MIDVFTSIYIFFFILHEHLIIYLYSHVSLSLSKR